MVAGQSKSEFLADRKSKLAGVMTLIIIGEAAVRISKRSQDYIDAHTEIPWEKIRGFRNRGAHGYDDLDFEIVWDALTADVPVLLQQVTVLLGEFGGPLPPDYSGS
ncbi:MAG TPA: HepT-like ribonuclease domain-containing protein [Devosia sp.]|uniref:HepT-like ribonuclease domain-containing protein n=1 Tax=Devosia sp. TaxID=1871048 RepID=UPI002DDD60C5|nr:HepT-like ribonuclease domain-containing protein [Devosia sp.]HEV2516668.1 HepT-like ribonuclease domain-containing protein [Devosia sp.]